MLRKAEKNYPRKINRTLAILLLLDLSALLGKIFMGRGGTFI